MLAEERMERIVEMVAEAGSMSVPDLASALGVTASTIRRDLANLSRAHRVAKVHGGAMSLERAHVAIDLDLEDRSYLHAHEKERIAQAAAAMLEADSYVYLDSGSTVRRRIDVLPQDPSITYVTDSAGHALRMAARGLHVRLLGGELKRQTESVVGPEALMAVERYNFSLGFWGVNGISATAGLTTPDMEEAAVKRASIGRCARPVVLADASKFDMIAPVTFADLDTCEVLAAGAVPEGYRVRRNVRIV